MIAVQGVLRGNTAVEIAYIVRNFQPDAVPLLNRHLGDPVGWVRSLMADGSDIWFIVATDDRAIAERLRRGAVSVSAELQGIGIGLEAMQRKGGTTIPGLLRSAYRGTLGPGYTLLAIATLQEGEPPARPGSQIRIPE